MLDGPDRFHFLTDKGRVCTEKHFLVFKMVRESDSSSESDYSSSELSINSDTDHGAQSSMSSEQNKESSFQNLSEFCRCQTDYRGGLDEKYCPSCTKLVDEEDDDSSVDWSMLERHFKLTKTYSASVENLLRESSLFFAEIDPSLKSSVTVEDKSDEGKSDPDDQSGDGMIDEMYQADGEDDAE